MMPADRDREVDVAIIGAGPAGCAAALTIATYTDLRVTMIERDITANKPGEMLPPDVVQLLEYLDIGTACLADGHKEAHRILAAWGAPELADRSLLFSGGRPAWHVDRTLFENQLRDAAQKRGVDQWHANLSSAVRTNTGWLLSGSDGDKVKTRFVVDASGRAARVARRESCPLHASDQTFAAWRIFDLPASRDHKCAGATMIEAVPDGWWYSSGLPGGRLAVAFFSDLDLFRDQRVNQAGGWQRMLRNSRHTATRLTEASHASAIQTRSATVRYFARAHGRDWIACGDAALTVDPLSSMGISLGLLTGIHAGRLAAAACGGIEIADSGYSSEIRRLATEHFETRRRFYAQETRWPDYPFWARRSSAAPETAPAAEMTA